MEKIITIGLAENFIEKLTCFLKDNYISKGADISRLAFVFGGRRPSLFLKKELSAIIGKSFLSPEFFSIEEFIRYIAAKKGNFGDISYLDDCYAIFTLARDIAPEMLKNRETFRKFLPWAGEISRFIENLDMELAGEKPLGAIQQAAGIGYDVPENINSLFKNIIKMRGRYHEALKGRKLLSRGMLYLEASDAAGNMDLSEFDTVFFCNFFYMHRAEEKIVKTIFDKGKAVLFFQGGQDDWPILEGNAKHFSCAIKPESEKSPSYESSLYSAFDMHSQVCAVREILKEIKEKKPETLDSTVIVTPDSKSLIPLLCESSSIVEDINVSMGYPLSDNPVHSLIKSIFDAQLSRKGKEYYAKDYLKVITNPLVKNFRLAGKAMKIADSSMLTRIIVHKIEEILRGVQKTKTIPGGQFVDLDDIGSSSELYDIVLNEIGNTVLKIEEEPLKEIVSQLHSLLFLKWEEIGSFRAFSVALESLVDALYEKSPLESFPLNRGVVELLSGMQEQLRDSSFKDEEFVKEDIFRIFSDSLEGKVIAFSGQPLKGLQVLGLLETRSLSFENVIIMDVNESVLPKLRINEPLIPRDIMAQLGLNLLEREEEIQRYYFKRLISCAKNVHLVFREGGDRQRSRFIEEIIWDEEKKKNALDALAVPAVTFKVEVLPEKKEIKKEKDVIEYLKKRSFSASSLDTYLGCSLKFYYKYVLCLNENENELDEPEPVDVGSFVHDFLDEAYRILCNEKFSISQEFRSHFKALLNKSFKTYFARRMGAEEFILKEVVNHRMENFLDNEKEREQEVEKVIGLERPFKISLVLNGETFRFGGIVDRIDQLKDGSMLVIDYKTGNAEKMSVKNVVSGNLEMTRDSITSVIKSFQLPIYLHFMKSQYKTGKLDAGLYMLKEPELNKLSASKEFNEQGNFDIIMSQTLKAMEHIICREILNPDVPFAPDAKEDHVCSICPFFYLCR